jgi:hypothetical protein
VSASSPDRPRLSLALLAASPPLPLVLLGIPLCALVARQPLDQFVTNGGEWLYAALGLAVVGAVLTSALVVTVTVLRLPPLLAGLGGLVALLGGTLGYAQSLAATATAVELAAPADRALILSGTLYEATNTLALGWWLAAVLWFGAGTALLFSTVVRGDPRRDPQAVWLAASSVVLVAAGAVGALTTLRTLAVGFAHGAWPRNEQLAISSVSVRLTQLSGLQDLLLGALGLAVLLTLGLALLRTRNPPQLLASLGVALLLLVGAGALSSWANRARGELEQQMLADLPSTAPLADLSFGDDKPPPVRCTVSGGRVLDEQDQPVAPTALAERLASGELTIALAQDASLGQLANVLAATTQDSVRLVGSPSLEGAQLDPAIEVLRALSRRRLTSVPVRVASACDACARVEVTDAALLLTTADGTRLRLIHSLGPAGRIERQAVVPLTLHDARALLSTIVTLRFNGIEPVLLRDAARTP